MKKRLVSLLLCLVMLISFVPMTAIAEDEVTNEAKTFTDVDPDDRLTDSIYYCVEKGYFTGTSETTFGPNEGMTRSMFVTVLAQYAGAELENYTEQSFTDVAVGKWYHAATEWAFEKNYVAGIGEGVFGYKNPITHQEIIAVLYAYVESLGVDMTPVENYRYSRCTDLEEISSWAETAMEWAGGLGMLDSNGHSGNMPLAAPKKTATRATLAFMLKTLDDALAEKVAPTLTISGNDISLYTIVTPENPERPVKDAAKRLTEWVSNAFAVNLTTVTDATEPTEYEILLGQTNREEMGLVTVERDVEDDLNYTVSVQGNYLVIAGNVDAKNRRGTLYGVFDLFDDHIGYGFLSDDMIEFDGQSHALEDGFTMTGGPGFESRVVYWRNGWDDIYNNDEDYHKGLFGIHELGKIIDPTLDDYTASRMANPCMTSDENFEIVVERVLEKLVKEPENRMVWLTQPDSWDYCECDDCMELINANGGRPSAGLYYFCDRVYDAIAEAGYPDTLILTLAYEYSKRPPTNMEPNDHIVIYYCPIDNCIFCPYNDETCPINRDMKEDIEIWSELCNKIYVWDYSTNFLHLVTPYPNYDNMLTNNTWFYEMGVRGVFNNAVTETNGEFGDLRAFLLTELYYEPTMSEEKYYAIMDEYLEGYYGAGWRNLRTYMDMMLDFSENYHWLCSFPPESGFSILQFAVHKDELNRLWDELESLAENDWQLENIQRSRLSCTFMIQNATWYTEYLLGTPQMSTQWLANNQKLWDDLKRLGVDLENENNPITFNVTRRPFEW